MSLARSARRAAAAGWRRANVMIMVTALLVLLVIIASAFLTRTQAGRQIASAQQSSQARQQRVDSITKAVVDEVAQSLFPRRIDAADPAFQGGFVPDPTQYGYPLVASTSYPRLEPLRGAVRYGVDPWNAFFNADLSADPAGDDTIIDGYNFAPFHVYPWTNWPDLFANNNVVSANHPLRLYEANPWGNPGYGDTRWLRSTEPMRAYDNNGLPFFTHWSHLSNPATANNGWTLIPDIADCDAGAAWFNTQNGTHEQERNGLFIPWEQWLPGVRPPDAFLVTGSTTGVGDSQNTLALAQQFRALADNWFYGGGASASGYINAVGGVNASPMPNFLRLAHFGPKREELEPDTARNLVSRRLCDTDGDGFTDSYWFMPPTSADRAVRYVVGVSVVDNSAMVNVNTATVFDRTQTAGLVPGDVSLMVRRDGSLGGTADSDAFNPLRAGLFGQYARLNGDGSVNLYPPLSVDLWRDQFGVSVDTEANPASLAVHGSPTDTRFIRELGLVRTLGSPTALGPIPGIDALLLSPLDRLHHYKALLNGGRLETFVDGNAAFVAGQRSSSRIDFFGLADEIELRRFAGHNDPVLSRLERSLDPALPLGAETGPRRDLLRASPARSESFEGFELAVGATSPPSIGKLTSLQLLHDTRRHLTTYNGARNEQLPPWLWSFPPNANVAASALGLATPKIIGAEGPDAQTQYPQTQDQAVAGDGNNDGTYDWRDEELARRDFLAWNQKVDLRSTISDPIYNGLQITNGGQILGDQLRFVNRLYTVFTRCMLDPVTRTSYFGTIDGTPEQFIRAQRMAASWATNVESWRDGGRKYGNTQIVVDDPFHPAEAPFVLEEPERRFLGNEKQPFITEVFFAVVYPKSRWSDVQQLAAANAPSQNQQVLDYLNSLTPPTDPFALPLEVPEGGGQHFVVYDPNSALLNPAVVIAVQIANPYNEPINLQPYRLRVGGTGGADNVFRFSQIPIPASINFDSPNAGQPYWGYGVSPILGPGTPEQPRTATVFAMPKQLAGDPLFRARFLDFLDLTHPWLIRDDGDSNRTDGWPYPYSLMFELDAAVQAAGNDPNRPEFPFARVDSTDPNGSGPGCDLYEDSRTAYPDSMVFNATRGEAGVQGGFDVSGSQASLQKYQNLPAERTMVELERVINPQQTNGLQPQWVVVDRFDNTIDQQQQTLSDSIERLLTERAFIPPTPEAALLAAGALGQPSLRYFNAMLLPAGTSTASGTSLDDFYAVWTRSARAWAWDVDGGGTIDADERSPNFVIARAGEPFVSEAQNPQRTYWEQGVQRQGFGKGSSWPAALDPDGNGQSLWMLKQSRLPIAGSPIWGKPTAFPSQTVFTGNLKAYDGYRYAGGSGSGAVFNGDKAAPLDDQWQIDPATGELRGGSDDIADLYQYPFPMDASFQMIQRDGDFESVAEIAMVPIWGPIWNDDLGRIEFTLPELLSISERDIEANPELADWWIGPPTTFGDNGIRVGGSPNRLSFPYDPTRRADHDQTVPDPRYSRQVLTPKYPFNPALPAGSAVFDAFTVDGPGRQFFDRSLTTFDGTVLTPAQNAALAEDRSPRLANGYSGRLTPGLININTAPVEVMRSLPHMGALAYNDQHPRGVAGVINPSTLGNESDALLDIYGPLAGGFPFGLGENVSTNGPRVRVPEAIATYREARPMATPFNQPFNSPFAEYGDRGLEDPNYLNPAYGFHAGMRRGQGIMSLGELALLRREAGLVPNGAPPTSYSRSWSMRYAGRDPYLLDANNPASGLGWDSNGPGATAFLDAKLSTDRIPMTLQYDFEPDNVQQGQAGYVFPQNFAESSLAEADTSFGDPEETNMLLSGIANLVTTRSDVFTVYIRIRSFTQNPATGRWDASERENVIEDTRYVMLVDRSNVDRPGEQPRVLYVERVDD
ncbi:MAG: hypothetical protein RL527_441 [Planctomycetota bacterium]